MIQYSLKKIKQMKGAMFGAIDNDLKDDIITIELNRELFYKKSDSEFEEYQKDFNFWTNEIWQQFLIEVKHAKKDSSIYNKLSNNRFRNRLKIALKFIGEYHVTDGEMQLRSCGNFFINHPMRQCLSAISESQDIKTYFPRLKVRDILISTVLHDVVEDGYNVNVKDIKSLFGKNISDIVDTVTKTSTEKDREKKTLENMTAMFTKMFKNPAAVITKMYDVRDNIRTLKYINKKCRRIRITLEALRFYVPIAEIVGALGFRHFREIKKLVLQYSRELLNDEEVIKELEKDKWCKQQYHQLKQTFEKTKTVYSIDRYIRVGGNNSSSFLSNLMKKLSKKKTASEMELTLFEIVKGLNVQKVQDSWRACVMEEDGIDMEKKMFKCYKLTK